MMPGPCAVGRSALPKHAPKTKTGRFPNKDASARQVGVILKEESKAVKVIEKQEVASSHRLGFAIFLEGINT